MCPLQVSLIPFIVSACKDPNKTVANVDAAVKKEVPIGSTKDQAMGFLRKHRSEYEFEPTTYFEDPGGLNILLQHLKEDARPTVRARMKAGIYTHTSKRIVYGARTWVTVIFYLDEQGQVFHYLVEKESSI